MGIFLDVVLWGSFVIVVVLGAGWVYLMARARRLDRKFGSFRCSTRLDSQSGWISGVGMYGTEYLEWFRLVSFSSRPALVLRRRGLVVSPPYPLTVDGTVVVVALESGMERVQVAIEAQTYNALVSWVESGPPRSDS